MVVPEHDQFTLEYRCRVRPEWIDYNGHLSEAYYVLAFGFATDQAMESCGMGPQYRRDTGNSLYTVEAHIRYLSETGEGAELRVTTTIAGSAAKKLHLAHEMRVGETLIATEELLALHVNSGTGRTTPFPDTVAGTIAGHTLAGNNKPPGWLGRSVSL